MARKKSRAELEAEIKFLKQGKVADAVTTVLTTLVQYGGLSVIAWFMYKSVETLAGQQTTADIGVEFLADVRVSTAAAWTGTVGSVGYGLRQRSLRRKAVERLQSRITSLEASIDPGRTSSTLTTRGETRPEDR